MKPVIIIFIALCACSKPLVRQAEQSRAEARTEASMSAYAGNSASLETLKADSILVVRYDTIASEKTVVKYYGIAKTKTDTVSISETLIETKTDTVYMTEKVFEKSEKSAFASIGTILKLLAALAAIICAALFMSKNFSRRTG